MASALTHGLAALALGKAATAGKMPRRFCALSVACSLLPDLDIIAFHLRVPYGHPFGHRGFSHSLAFAAIAGMLVVLLAFRDVTRWSRRWWGLAVFFFLVTASHGVLDAMTNGGYGIGFFIPFVNTRYFLPWRPLMVSPIGVRGFFSRWGWNVVKNELLWIWIPLVVLTGLAVLVRRRIEERSKSSLHPPVDE